MAYKAIEAELTDEERDVFRRGRNAKSHVPKSATVAEYRASTGFEALLGTLYIEKKFARLEEIAAKSFDVISKEMMKKINEKKK
jgi:ribonuclease-3 family protein